MDEERVVGATMDSKSDLGPRDVLNVGALAPRVAFATGVAGASSVDTASPDAPRALSAFSFFLSAMVFLSPFIFLVVS
jgi:hypothetical protein